MNGKLGTGLEGLVPHIKLSPAPCCGDIRLKGATVAVLQVSHIPYIGRQLRGLYFLRDLRLRKAGRFTGCCLDAWS